MLAATAIARRLLPTCAIGDRLGEFGRQVKGIVLQFPQYESLKDDRFSLQVSQQMPQLASDVDAALEDQFTGPSGGLLAVADGKSSRPPSVCRRTFAFSDSSRRAVVEEPGIDSRRDLAGSHREKPIDRWR